MNTIRFSRGFKPSCFLPASTCLRAYTTINTNFFDREVGRLANSTGCVSRLRHALCGGILANVSLSNARCACRGPLGSTGRTH